MNNEKLIKALNEQLNFEIESAYIYKGMANWLASEDWNGFSHFMTKQVYEELEHAGKIERFLLEIGEKIELTEVPQPKNEYASVNEVMQIALEHEKEVTRRFNNLMDIAREVDDKRIEIFLQWFITEQVEEEATFEGIIVKLDRLTGKDGANITGLYMLNAELGRRE